jgi:hypothetical protein
LIQACEACDLPEECQTATAELLDRGADRAVRDEAAELEQALGIELDPKGIESYAEFTLHTRYVANHGRGMFRLAAVRLVSAAHRFAAEKGRCPQPADFENALLAELRIDPYSGRPIRIDTIDEGRLLLTSPSSSYNDVESSRPASVFVCQVQKKSAGEEMIGDPENESCQPTLPPEILEQLESPKRTLK